jgi:hypothetical protein
MTDAGIGEADTAAINEGFSGKPPVCDDVGMKIVTLIVVG